MRFADRHTVRERGADDGVEGVGGTRPDHGEVHRLAEAVADLVKQKPYLAAQGGRRFQGTADGGPRKETRKPQLTRDDAKRMSPEEIETAREAGQFDDLLGIKRKT